MCPGRRSNGQRPTPGGVFVAGACAVRVIPESVTRTRKSRDSCSRRRTAADPCVRLLGYHLSSLFVSPTRCRDPPRGRYSMRAGGPLEASSRIRR